MMLFGRKKSDKPKSPAQMTAFERRQSMAAKFEMEERAKSGEIDIPPPPATEVIGKNSPSNGKKASMMKANNSPPTFVERKPADPEYIEFTVVPMLLRSKVAYDEANKYGESLKRMTEAEVKVICANAQNLFDDVKKCGIKVPATFEKDLHDDMFWKAGGTAGNRKSFVYYRPSDSAPEPRPKSDSSHDPLEKTKEQTRQRASFAGGALPPLEESDPNRYKVRSRTKQAESLSHDLADLVSSLDAINATKKS